MSRTVKVGSVAANPLLQLGEVVAQVADLLPYKEVAENSLNLARKLDSDFTAIKPQVFDALSKAEVADLNAGRAILTADEVNLRNIEIGQRVGTLDVAVQGQIANIRKVELDALSAQKTAALAASKADEGIGLAKQAGQLAGDALNTAKDAGGKALSALGKAADLFDRVANIFNLIATLGTIARMEQIAANSKARDADLQNNIDGLASQLSGIIKGLMDANGRIDINVKDIDSLENQLVGIETSLNALLTNTSALLTGQNSIQSNITQTRNKVDTSISQNTLIKKDTEYLITLTNEIPNRIIPAIRPQVCLALKDPNCNSGSGGSDCDLSGVESTLDEISQKLGIFPYNCTTSQPSDGFYTTVSESLQSLTCGIGGGGAGKTLEEIFEEKDRTDELLDALENLPEPTLYVPDDWAIKIEGDRPQLIAGMQDAATAGQGSASKWQIVIPRPLPNIESWTWEELVAYFPDYSRGKHLAMIRLTDNSVMAVRGSTKSVASEYLERMYGLVDPRYKPGEFSPIYGENSKFKTVAITCRGLGYYETGRRQGEKPTKRWYYPVETNGG